MDGVEHAHKGYSLLQPLSRIVHPEKGSGATWTAYSNDLIDQPRPWKARSQGPTGGDATPKKLATNQKAGRTLALVDVALLRRRSTCRGTGLSGRY